MSIYFNHQDRVEPGYELLYFSTDDVEKLIKIAKSTIACITLIILSNFIEFNSPIITIIFIHLFWFIIQFIHSSDGSLNFELIESILYFNSNR